MIANFKIEGYYTPLIFFFFFFREKIGREVTTWALSIMHNFFFALRQAAVRARPPQAPLNHSQFFVHVHTTKSTLLDNNKF
jgi:hypothetical protein